MRTLLQVNLREASRSLWASKQRSLLALIGIVIGIGSVIGMVSIGSIVQNEVLRQFKDMGIDIMTVRKSYDGGTKSEFRLNDIMKLKEECRSVYEVAPYLTGSMEYAQGRNKSNLELMGVTEAFFDLNKLHIRVGRAISDMDQHRYFCVIGSETAELLQKSGNANILGTQITVNSRAYRIIGILDKAPEGGLRPFGINRGILAPLSTALRAFENPDINTVMVRVNAQMPIEQVKSDIQSHFKRKARDMRVEMNSAEELIERMKKQMKMFSLLLGAIGSIALIVGGIGVMNVMLISVSERRSEIGLRRALGAQQRDIQSQFLIESVILCLAGGIIGIIIGIGVSFIFAYFSKWQFIMSYLSIILGFGVSTAVGVFCGFYPARQAAMLDPIKALKS